MLQDLVNKPIFVRLKWGQVEYKGTLVSVDSYMNLQLSGTEEYVSDKPTGVLGQVLIRYVASGGGYCQKSHVGLVVLLTKLPYRCNNVLWIRAADEGKDTTMTG